MSSQEAVTHTESEVRLIGRVKWFNNKAGYGFITVTDGAKSGSDIFVHHSAISVGNQQFKYLVQGEYVELSEVAASSGPHECQASNVIGVKGGKLMCETRNELKIARNNYKNTQKESVQVETQPVAVESQSVPVKKTSKPRGPPKGKKSTNNVSNDVSEQNEWTQVKNKAEKPKRSPRKPKVVEEPKV